MKNVLIISYLYPPTTSSQAEHVKNLSNYLSDFYNVTVITADWINNNKFKNNYQGYEKRNNLEICNLDFGILHKINYEAKNTDKKDIKKDNYLKKMKKNITLSLKSRIIPDATFDWFFVAKKWLKNNVGKYDVVISIATPYTDLMIAKKFLKMHKTSEKPKLISCYADPWYGEISRNRGFLRRNIEKNIEKNILKNSDNVLMVTKNARDYYRNIFPEFSKKIDYYYIGHDIDLEKTKNLDEKKEGKITFRYFGALQNVHRNPFVFLEALNKEEYLGKIKLELYLIEDKANDKIIEFIQNSKFLNYIVIIKKPVPYKEMLEIASGDGINILFGNTSDLQIPVKMFDYIGVKSKILYIENNPNKEINEILNSYGGSIICNNNYSSIESAINKIVNKEYKTNQENIENIYNITKSFNNFKVYKKLIDTDF